MRNITGSYGRRRRPIPYDKPTGQVSNGVKKWIEKEGKKFLKEIGIKKEQAILDFGCGEGHYTIPAAKVVGKGGKVYAADKDKRVLDKLMKIATSKGFKNIEPIKMGGLKIPLKHESLDGILLYDVLHPHYFNADNRKKLLREIYRISRTDALISVYPKHMELGYILKEMERVDFRYGRKLFKKLVHDNSYDKGYILNFKKEI